MTKIDKIEAMEVLDSRGHPTVAVWVEAGGQAGQAVVPSGVSTGAHEAVELRDNDARRFYGNGTLKAVENIEKTIFPAIQGQDVTDQVGIDTALIQLDGTENKSKLGANAILGVSLAVCRAGAAVTNQPLYYYLRQKYFKDLGDDWVMPVPLMNILNGGKHAPGSVDLQEFMIAPRIAERFAESLRWGVETYWTLKKILLALGLPVGVGDEGGFMPKLTSNKQALDLLVDAIGKAGFTPGSQIALALDPAASTFFDKNEYTLKTENKKLMSAGMIQLYQDWAKTYPIVSIEDGLAEDDWDGFKFMTETMGKTTQIVGDDLYATNPKRLERGIKEKSTNAVLIKLNQIGTLSETASVMKLAKINSMAMIISHRSGDTEDDFIADLAVASNAGQIKTGAPCRTERVTKYNRLLKIEKELGNRIRFKDPFIREVA